MSENILDRKDEVVAALRRGCAELHPIMLNRFCIDTADLIEAQAARIAELEMVRDAALEEYHRRLEFYGIACDYCAHNTDDPADCPQEDENVNFCEFWKWYGADMRGEQNGTTD